MGVNTIKLNWDDIMKKKYILVVNLRRLTKEAYISLQAIKTQGFNILLIAKEMPSYCKDIVDNYVPVDTKNYDLTIATVKQLSKEFVIAGVVAFTETAVEICSYIANELNLPGNPVEAVKYSRNKLAMRQQLLKADIEQIPHLHIKDIKQLKDGIVNIGFPVIVKPINSSGSTGIFHLTCNEDVKVVIDNLKNINNPSYDPISRTNTIEFIIEKYIEGPEVSVEGLVFNSEVSICGITDKLTTMDYKIEYQHIFPSAFSEHQKEIIQLEVKKIIACLGFDNCSFHLEGKLYNDKFYLIEVATRPAGGYIASHLIPNATNQNYYEDLVKIAVGIRPTTQYTAKSYSGIRFIIAQNEGVFSSINNWSDLTQHPLVNSLFVETEIGSQIRLPPKDYRSLRLFAYIVNGASYIEVSDTLSTLANLAQPTVQE